MKYKAFTIAELVVGMLLTSLVTGLAYYSFFLFRQQFMQMGQNIVHKNEYQLLHKALRHDFDEAISIRDSSEIYLIIQTKTQHITYTFTENNITRETGSFDVKVNKTGITHIGNMVNELTLYVQTGKHQHTLFLTKIYSSQQLMHE